MPRPLRETGDVKAAAGSVPPHRTRCLSTPLASRSRKPSGKVGSDGTLSSLRDDMAEASLIALSVFVALSILLSMSASSGSFKNASSFMPFGTCCSKAFFSAVISDCFAVVLASSLSTSSARRHPSGPRRCGRNCDDARHRFDRHRGHSRSQTADRKYGCPGARPSRRRLRIGSVRRRGATRLLVPRWH